jgi:hypothetical protein
VIPKISLSFRYLFTLCPVTCNQWPRKPLAPSAGIGPATCGLGSLYCFFEAFTSDNKATLLKRIRVHSFAGDKRRHEGHVHFFVHLPTDIHPLKNELSAISVVTITIGCNGQMIYKTLVPSFLRTLWNSCAAAVQRWSIILSDTWTNTRAFLFGLPQQSSERWTCWRVSVMHLVGKWYARLLSSTSLPNSDLLKHQIRNEVGEYLESHFVMPC